MKMTTVGIDLAKNVIQVHGVDERGKAVLRKPLKREQVASFFATLPPLPDRHGSLRQRASLGEEAGSVRAYRKADGPAVRLTALILNSSVSPLRQPDQEGPGPCAAASWV